MRVRKSGLMARRGTRERPALSQQARDAYIYPVSYCVRFLTFGVVTLGSANGLVRLPVR